MLLGLSHKVQEKIVVVLADRGALPGPDILSAVRPRVSKQALYQELRKLIADGVIIKAGQLYALRFAWILRLEALAHKMHSSSLQSADILWLPEQGRKKWTLPSLKQALQVWSHLSMILFRTEEKKFLFEYVPHAWYHLINTNVEEQFQEILRREKIKFNLIVGGDTFVDRSYEKYFSMSGESIAFGHNPFGVSDEEHFSVIGDSIIRVTFTKKYARALDQSFADITAWGAEEVNKLGKVLAVDTPVSVEISRNAVLAKRFAKKFVNFF